MLVLSRKKNEVILIGDQIRLTIVELDRGKVRVGIEAPKEVKVFREEIAGTAPQAKAG
jgi:carbon storage regulator